LGPRRGGARGMGRGAAAETAGGVEGRWRWGAGADGSDVARREVGTAHCHVSNPNLPTTENALEDDGVSALCHAPPRVTNASALLHALPDVCVALCVSDCTSPSLDAKCSWVKPGVTTPLFLLIPRRRFHQKWGARVHSLRQMPPPSRQERRKAERDAAKRMPAQAGAAGAGGAAAARANINVNPDPLGDWTTQSSNGLPLFAANGVEGVKRMADRGRAVEQPLEPS